MGHLTGRESRMVRLKKKKKALVYGKISNGSDDKNVGNL